MQSLERLFNSIFSSNTNPVTTFQDNRDRIESNNLNRNRNRNQYIPQNNQNHVNPTLTLNSTHHVNPILSRNDRLYGHTFGNSLGGIGLQSILSAPRPSTISRRSNSRIIEEQTLSTDVSPSTVLTGLSSENVFTNIRSTAGDILSRTNIPHVWNEIERQRTRLSTELERQRIRLRDDIYLRNLTIAPSLSMYTLMIPMSVLAVILGSHLSMYLEGLFSHNIDLTLSRLIDDLVSSGLLSNLDSGILNDMSRGILNELINSRNTVLQPCVLMEPLQHRFLQDVVAEASRSTITGLEIVPYEGLTQVSTNPTTSLEIVPYDGSAEVSTNDGSADESTNRNTGRNRSLSRLIGGVMLGLLLTSVTLGNNEETAGFASTIADLFDQ